ncbi:class I SAM-dependent methyltransferase [Aspergillus undulatus]|uniref:class I SAM-dependent methyltransferase n=1 Tax=Aspergillus undulatus TaxID=1810928 RepID=UPI003CCD2F55
MALPSTHSDPRQRELGFQGHGFDCNKYIKYGPVYCEALYGKLSEYHSSHPSNTFNTAHDVGAGAGTVSEILAKRFKNVIVSEPDTEFLEIAKEGRLSSPSRADLNSGSATGSGQGDEVGEGEGKVKKKKFTFLSERAEQSIVASGTVDLLIINKAIHWTDIPASIAEFARQLKSNGMLCNTFYGQVWITDNAEAQAIFGGGGGGVIVAWPNVQILATRR